MFIFSQWPTKNGYQPADQPTLEGLTLEIGG